MGSAKNDELAHLKKCSLTVDKWGIRPDFQWTNNDCNNVTVLAHKTYTANGNYSINVVAMTHVKNDLVQLWWTQTYLTHHQHIDLVGFGLFFHCRMLCFDCLRERKKKTLENQSISILLLAIVDTCSMLILVCAHAACDQPFVSFILLKNWLINNCFCCWLLL